MPVCVTPDDVDYDDDDDKDDDDDENDTEICKNHCSNKH